MAEFQRDSTGGFTGELKICATFKKIFLNGKIVLLPAKFNKNNIIGIFLIILSE